MATVKVFNQQGQVVSDMSLKDEVFGVNINEVLVHKAVVTQLANMRQGTHSAKTRSEVRGGGRKPWRQKGTGHARQGSIRAPQWKGGGMVFAIKPRDYSLKMNKKEKRYALLSALTSRVNEDKLIVVDEIKLNEIKTKEFANILKALNVEKALVVLKENDKIVMLSGRNIPNVKMSLVEQINVYDILKYDKIVAAKDAIELLEEVYS